MEERGEDLVGMTAVQRRPRQNRWAVAAFLIVASVLATLLLSSARSSDAAPRGARRAEAARASQLTLLPVRWVVAVMVYATFDQRCDQIDLSVQSAALMTSKPMLLPELIVLTVY